MTIKTIERLEDMKGMRADESVRIISQDIFSPNMGIVYNIGQERFSVISIMPLGGQFFEKRVSYDWNQEKKSFMLTDIDQPFAEDSAEGEKYATLLNSQEGEFLQSIKL